MSPRPTQFAHAGPTTLRPARTHARGWAAYLSLKLLLLQLPWLYGGIFREAFDAVGGTWSPVDHRGFITGRTLTVALVIGAAVLSSNALLGRRPGRHRVVAELVLTLSFVLLVLIDLGTKWRAGD